MIQQTDNGTVSNLSTPHGAVEASCKVAPAEARKYLATRLLSGVALCTALFLAVKLLIAGYYIFTDAFVAPIILSPDSELVLPSKLSLARLQAERTALLARIEQASAAIDSAKAGSTKLLHLKDTLAHGLSLVESESRRSARATSRELSVLGAQELLIQSRITEQQALLTRLERELASGLVRKEDLARERDALNHLRLQALQNERERVEHSAHLEPGARAQRALLEADDAGPLDTPEMVQQRAHLIHLELDLLKLEAEGRAQASELKHAQSELQKLDQLIEQVRARPVFRAIESQQHVAFVPYTQIEDIVAGAVVHDCCIWGMLACHKAGVVAVVLPGEIAAPDPWGTVTRGQYALLELSDPSAAKSKVLRVRSSGAD